MDEDYNEKIELLADLLNKRLDLVSMRIEVLERAITISHNLSLKLLDIQRDLLQVANLSNDLIQHMQEKKNA
jgi:hypothetical protein